MARHVDVRDRHHRDLTTVVGMQSGGRRVHAVRGVIVAGKRSKKFDVGELFIRRVNVMGNAGGRKNHAHTCSTVAYMIG